MHTFCACTSDFKQCPLNVTAPSMTRPKTACTPTELPQVLKLQLLCRLQADISSLQKQLQMHINMKRLLLEVQEDVF